MADDAGERWLTYRELGELLGCTSNAARMHAQRRRWPKRAANRVGDPARVLVPENEAVRPRAMHGAPAFVAQPNGHDAALVQTHMQALAQAVEALREQLTIANRRIDELTIERRQLFALLTAPTRTPWRRRWFR
jgi:hypothetical protein